MTNETNNNLIEYSTTIPSNRRYYPLLLMLFVASGCSALIYEIVWFQMLQLVIGLSALSLGILLGAYMGGMFLGSIALTRLISARRHPLRVYAILESGIGIMGIIILFSMPYIDQLYITSVGNGYATILLRCTVCVVSLLLPTLMMGATLPAIGRYVGRTPFGVSWLGIFYSGNIVGAICGCLLAGFYFLRMFDVAVATYVAASINFAVAAIGIWLASRTPYRVTDSAPEEAHTTREPGFQLVYLVIALSGLCALGAEVVWTRLLSHLLGTTVYTFAIVLAVFLVGLGIGSGAGSFLVRRFGYPHLLLGMSQLLLTGAITWAAYAINHSPSFWQVDPIPSNTFLLDMQRCLLAILPATVLWGASFPLALASVVSRRQEPGQQVGEVYAANTFGAIVGAIGFSIFVIPRFGTQHAQQLILGLSGASAIMIFFVSLQQTDSKLLSRKLFRSPVFRVAFIPICLCITILLACNVSTTSWALIAGPAFLADFYGRAVPGITTEKDIPSGGGTFDEYCTFLGEGMSESVVVTKSNTGVRSFFAAGKAQATNLPEDMRLQRMLGHISALTADNPRSVLVVACGAGVTAGTYVLYPSIHRIVICELEKMVPDYVTPQFKKENYDVLNDPRTEVVIDDGRHFVRTTREKFDIITSDPIDPCFKGAAALYTVEYFAACRKHLNPGGTMALWIPLYGISPEAVKSLFSAFFKSFPEGIIWSNEHRGGGYDAVLFGQAGPAHIDIDRVQERLNSPEYLQVKQSLIEVGFHSATELFSTYAGYGPMMEHWLSDAQINSDRNMRLQYLAGISVNVFRQDQILGQILLCNTFPENVFSGSDKSILELKKGFIKRH